MQLSRPAPSRLTTIALCVGLIAGCTAESTQEAVVDPASSPSEPTLDSGPTSPPSSPSTGEAPKPSNVDFGLLATAPCTTDPQTPIMSVAADLYKWLPINHMANVSQDAVLATVVDISTPRFTTLEPTKDGEPVPQVYFRILTISIDETLFGEFNVSRDAAVVLPGAGNITPTELCFGDDGLAGPELALKRGDQVLVLLDFIENRSIKDYPTTGAYHMPFGWLSLWRITDGRAESISASHQTTLSSLVERLRAERETGLVPWPPPDDGIFDPLVDEPPEGPVETLPDVTTPPPGLPSEGESP